MHLTTSASLRLIIAEWGRSNIARVSSRRTINIEFDRRAGRANREALSKILGICNDAIGLRRLGTDLGLAGSFEVSVGEMSGDER